MTDRVEPSPNKGNKVFPTTSAIRWAGFVNGWIAPTDEAYVADEDSTLSGAPLNAFDATTSASSLTVTIDTGEGFVDGRWLARDVTTDVTLAASTTNQTVYAGWAFGQPDTVRIGLDADFSSNDGRVSIWTFDTDGSGVISETSERAIGPPMSSEGGDLVVEALMRITDVVELDDAYIQATEPTTEFSNAPLRIGENTAYSHRNGFLTLYNTDAGWVFRNHTGDGNILEIEADTGNARFPHGHVQIAVENRTDRPSGTQPGRIIYRTDKEQ